VDQEALLGAPADPHTLPGGTEQTLVDASTAVSPGVQPEDDTQASAGASADTLASLVPAQRPAPSRARKWLVPALTVVVGLLVTGGVLLMLFPDREPVRATGVAALTTPTPQNDVGRRYTTGSFDQAQFVVPRPAKCGLTSYDATTAQQGRLCVVGWTLMNPGGDAVPTAASPPALVDDRGGRYEPLSASTQVPTSLAPGAKLDGVLIYDLPQGRTAATLKLRLSDTSTIEVRL
jgi:hypothetical protein